MLGQWQPTVGLLAGYWGVTCYNFQMIYGFLSLKFRFVLTNRWNDTTLQHLIWMFTVCKLIYIGLFSLQRVKFIGLKPCDNYGCWSFEWYDSVIARHLFLVTLIAWQYVSYASLCDIMCCASDKNKSIAAFFYYLSGTYLINWISCFEGIFFYHRTCFNFRLVSFQFRSHFSKEKEEKAACFLNIFLLARFI